MITAGIPSSPISAISLGPLTVHFYALCILAGIFVAFWWGTRRWMSRGGDPDTFFDIGFAGVIAGIIGARVWHVLTSPQLYFGEGRDLIRVLYVWEGGLAIYGGVAGGALGVWLWSRRSGASFTVLADVIAPTLMVAQAIGRFGNWFNQELYGPPTDAPWGWDVTCVTNGERILGCEPGTYHPTFLYEALWLLAGCAVLLAVSRRFDLAGGRVFWLYVVIAGLGRTWIDAMRSEPVLMIGPLRIHTLIALGMALGAAIIFAALTARRRRGGEARAADGSFDLPAQTQGNGPDSDAVEKSGTPPSGITRSHSGP